MKPALRSKLNAREFAMTWNMLHIASRLNSDLGAINRNDKMGVDETKINIHKTGKQLSEEQIITKHALPLLYS